jgi:RNA polymerase sigma-70 factor (ECF subfamily)
MDDDYPTIQEIQEGQEAGLVELMEKYREPVFRLAYRYVYSEADATEIVQTVFIKIWNKAAYYRPTSNVKSWIFSITANHCKDQLRRKKYRAQFVADGPVEASDELGHGDEGKNSPSRKVETKENLRHIEGVIAKLPEKLKFPFIFCVLENHSYDECADVIGTNRKTVETRIYRARKTLRQALEEENGKI